MVQQCAKKFEEACMPFQYARLQEPGQIALLGWSGHDGIGSHESTGLGLRPTGEDVGGFPQQCLSGLFLSFVRISYGKDSTHARPHDEKYHMRSCRVRGEQRNPSCLQLSAGDVFTKKHGLYCLCDGLRKKRTQFPDMPGVTRACPFGGHGPIASPFLCRLSSTREVPLSRSPIVSFR